MRCSRPSSCASGPSARRSGPSAMPRGWRRRSRGSGSGRWRHTSGPSGTSRGASRPSASRPTGGWRPSRRRRGRCTTRGRRQSGAPAASGMPRGRGRGSRAHHVSARPSSAARRWSNMNGRFCCRHVRRRLRASHSVRGASRRLSTSAKPCARITMMPSGKLGGMLPNQLRSCWPQAQKHGSARREIVKMWMGTCSTRDNCSFKRMPTNSSTPKH
mmetsp:Transcript_1118/g.3204  ORF Transcript_1118/g.3204 Transcript_1118/m.3204 type:complete len:215 (-) Transcript_1118:342-986(-)